MHTTKKFKDLTQKKRQLSHFLNFYVFLTVELPRHASVELQSSAMRQIDVIVERFDDRPQQTTKLIL